MNNNNNSRSRGKWKKQDSLGTIAWYQTGHGEKNSQTWTSEKNSSRLLLAGFLSPSTSDRQVYSRSKKTAKFPDTIKFNAALRPHRPCIRTVMDGEPRTATSTSATQLLSSNTAHCCFTSTQTMHEDCYGRRAQDGHLDLHTAPKLCWHHPQTYWIESQTRAR